MTRINDTLIISDIDECLTCTIEHLQRYVWDRFEVWFDPGIIRSFYAGQYVLDAIKKAYTPTDKNLREAIQDHHPFLNLTQEEFDRDVDIAIWKNPEAYVNLRPYYDYWQALWKWVRLQGKLVFVTSRVPELEGVTRGWLARWGLGNTPVHYTRFGGKLTPKLDYVQQIMATLKPEKAIFVEDRFKYAEQVAKELGIVAIMPAHPWNHRPDAIGANHVNGVELKRMPHSNLAHYIETELIA